MSNRERLSGYQYRQAAKRKAEKENEVVNKTRKLDTWFSQNNRDQVLDCVTVVDAVTPEIFVADSGCELHIATNGADGEVSSQNNNGT